MKRLIGAFLFFVTVFSMSSIEIKISKDYRVDETADFKSDYLFVGEHLNLAGTVEDLFFFGNKLETAGEVKSSAISFGKYIDYIGNIGNDIISAAEMLKIAGNVRGNAFLVGEDVVIEDNAVIHGTVFAGAGKLFINGTVKGDVYVGSGRLVINGVVEGNVTAASRMISINEGGYVNGDFTYYSKYRLQEKVLSRVGGNVVYESGFTKGPEEIKGAFVVIKVLMKLALLLSFVIGGLLILLLPFTRNIRAESRRNYFNSFLWGLIPFFTYPAVVVSAFVLGVTIPLGIMLVMIALPMLFVTQLIGVAMTGEILWNTFKWQSSNRFLYFLFGSLFYIVLSLIPVIGVFVLIFTSAVGWGVIISGVFERKL